MINTYLRLSIWYLCNFIIKFSNKIAEKGYIKLDPSDFSDWQIDFASLRCLMDWLKENEIPMVFAFVFDEYWYLYMRLGNVIGALLGPDYQRLTDMWAWRVDDTTREQGWNIHRDNPEIAFSENKTLLAVTVWLPLGEVTTHHACMNVIPKDVDNNLQLASDYDAQQLLQLLPNIRSLPVKPGGALIWDQNILHFSSKPDRFTKSPRYSVSMEFERYGQTRSFRGSNPYKLPTLTERLQAISGVLDRYFHMYIEETTKNQKRESVEWKHFAKKMRTDLPYTEDFYYSEL